MGEIVTRKALAKGLKVNPSNDKEHFSMKENCSTPLTELRTKPFFLSFGTH